MNSQTEIKDDIKDNIKEKARILVSQMTLEEKAGLCSGEDCWNTKAIKRLGLDSITMMDGPHGLRKQVGFTDNLGIGTSVPAVCFPTASAIACSFDRKLIYEVGKAIGEECVTEGVSLILGPGVNQKRSPLCGRNFEYYSEDPLLSGELAASMILGVQSTGTGTSLKHFAVNNQEKRRMTINAIVDERALRENYLKAFEIAVKKGKPDTVMCSYNRVNGDYSSENKYLLTDILRGEWDFKGAVISDWGAVHDRVLGIKAGLDLEMPGNKGYNDTKILEALKKGILKEEELDKTACRVTELVLKSLENKRDAQKYDPIAHHSLATKAAEQSAVLLKNEDKLLPGNKGQKIAVVGAFAKYPRYQGAGSSKINPIKVDSPWESFMDFGLDVTYAAGYELSKKSSSDQDILIKEACEIVRKMDLIYLFAGLPEGYESEGFDRADMKMPEEQNRLIEAISIANPNVAVILIGGAPMELPWIDKVKAVLLTYLGGEGVGKAIVNLLLGEVVPSGKLAETWPLVLNDTPACHYFPGGRLTTEYRESIYTGYRYYEKADKKVLFPFGHGLSYVDFKYSALQTDRQNYQVGEKINISFRLKNDGKCIAQETTLIFVSHEDGQVFFPKKELREFIKTTLEPGETKEITVSISTSELGFYNTRIKDWYLESGDYKIYVGGSSANCNLEQVIYIESVEKPQPDIRKLSPGYFNLKNQEFIIDRGEFEVLYGKKLPLSDETIQRPYGPGNTLEDIRHTLIGKIIVKYAEHILNKATQTEEEQEGMMSAMIMEMPFFAMVASGDGLLTESMMEGILEMLNGHYLRGIMKFIKGK